MKQIVYADVLIFVNTFVNYFLLISCSKLLRIKANRWRVLLGSLLGGLYSLVIFSPPMGNVATVALNTAFSAILVLITFKVSGIKSFLKTFCGFFAMNFSYAGVMVAIWFAFKPNGMYINNGKVYFNINILVLAITTIITYVIISIISYFTRKNAPDNHIFLIEISINGKKIHGKALLDTGNALTDSFSDTPVIIAEKGFVKPLLTAEVFDCVINNKLDFNSIEKEWAKRLRLVAYHSVKDAGLLVAFRPDSILVKGSSKTIETSDVFIAVSGYSLAGGEYDVLLNNRLFDDSKSTSVKRYSIKT